METLQSRRSLAVVALIKNRMTTQNGQNWMPPKKKKKVTKNVTPVKMFSLYWLWYCMLETLLKSWSNATAHMEKGFCNIFCCFLIFGIQSFAYLCFQTQVTSLVKSKQTPAEDVGPRTYCHETTGPGITSVW